METILKDVEDRLVLDEYYIAATLLEFADHLVHDLFPSLEPPDCREEASPKGWGPPARVG